MENAAFDELTLRASIAPQQARWPEPHFLHWQHIHSAADELREREALRETTFQVPQMISRGRTVTCRQTGTQLWVVRSAAHNGRWHLVGKRTDTLGRRRFTNRVAGEGDLVEILATKTYRIGNVVERHGKQHLVLSDDGDEITLAVPEDRIPLRGGYTVHVAAGNSTLVSKADLLLEALK